MKQKIKEHLWVISGIISAYIGFQLSIHFFSDYGLFYIGVATVVIMSAILALMGIISWFLIGNRNKKTPSTKTAQSNEVGTERTFKKHWIEITTVLLVIIVFLGYIILHATSYGEFSSDKLNAVAFPAFVFCQLLELFIILRSWYLIKKFLRTYPEINDIQALDTLKPIVSQCMIMALVFIVLLLSSMLLTAVIFISWGILYGAFAAISLTLMSQISKWYIPYENRLKQIHSNDPLLAAELNDILQNWHNDAFPKF